MRWEKTEEPLSESYVYICYMLCLVTQSCPTCCDPMDCSLPGSFVQGDSPGVAMPFSNKILYGSISFQAVITKYLRLSSLGKTNAYFSQF